MIYLSAYIIAAIISLAITKYQSPL